MLGRTNTGGGGGGLNFRVLGDTTAPLNPKENDIWVITSEKIKSYTISATAPEAPIPGMVWILPAASGEAVVSVTKKNPVNIYPMSAKQYINGEWAEVTAKNRQNGKWADWWKGELYKDGNEYVDVTGGWICEGRGMASGSDAASTEPTITRGATSMTFHNNKGGGGVYRTDKKIDLAPYTRLVLKCDATSVASSTSFCNMYAWKEMYKYYDNDDYWVAKTNIKTNGANLEFELNLEGCNDPGGYYVGFGLWSATPTLVVKSLVLK